MAKPEFVILTCACCHKEFQMKYHVFRVAEWKGRKNHYCSKECMSKAYKKQVTYICENCGKESSKPLSEYNLSKHHYCSIECAHKKINHSHPRTQEQKDKVAQTLKEYYKTHTSLRQIKVKEKIQEKIQKECPICHKEFFVWPCKSTRIYCSKECYLKDSSLQYRKCGKGGYRKGSGRSKHGWYKGYWCDSSYELAFVIYNLEHNIKFTRNNEGFSYEYNGKTYKYYPDFILDDGTYIEIKGFFTEKVNAKLKNFPYKLQILYKQDLKEQLDYVIKKYGNNFIELYEGNPYNQRLNTCVICGKPAKNLCCSRHCSGVYTASLKNSKKI